MAPLSLASKTTKQPQRRSVSPVTAAMHRVTFILHGRAFANVETAHQYVQRAAGRRKGSI